MALKKYPCLSTSPLIYYFKGFPSFPWTDEGPRKTKTSFVQNHRDGPGQEAVPQIAWAVPLKREVHFQKEHVGF